MTAETDLLPCPFCGEGDHLLVEHLEGTIIHPAYRVRCDNCGACIEYTDRDCHAAWNTRANLAERDAEVALLRQERERADRLAKALRDAADDLDRGVSRGDVAAHMRARAALKQGSNDA